MKRWDHAHYILGEGPVWDAVTKRYYWVDIFDNKILSVSQALNDYQVIPVPDKVGCVVLTEEGKLLAALAKEIVKIDPHSHQLTYLTQKTDIGEHEMFNDGKVDCMGRFWIATKDIREDNHIAKLYLYDGKSLTEKDRGFIVGNGLDWTPDNRKMFFTDSPAQTIYQYDFDKKTGAISNQTVFANVDRGLPDGLTVDSEGNVWGAHWNGHCVTCYSPNGEVLERLEMPCEKPTSCAFGGEDLKTLMITSASFESSTDGRQNGYVFFKEMKVSGKPCFLAKI